jgi:hypothetical protein
MNPATAGVQDPGSDFRSHRRPGTGGCSSTASRGVGAGYHQASASPRLCQSQWAKTDRMDAAVLAHFGEALQPAVTVLASAPPSLPEGVTRRRQLVEMLTFSMPSFEMVNLGNRRR